MVLFYSVLEGATYEAAIRAILLPLRYAGYPFLPKSEFSVSGRKLWTIAFAFFIEIEVNFCGPFTPLWKML